MSDVLAHAGYSSVTTHPLKAIWIEGHSHQVCKETLVALRSIQRLSHQHMFFLLDARQRRNIIGDARGDSGTLCAGLRGEERLVPGTSEVHRRGAQRS